MRATWNPYVGFAHIYWVCVSYVVTTTMFALIFFPFFRLGRYVLGWPLVASVLITIVLSMICCFSKRDCKVSISVVSQGLMYRDEAVGYKRQELIRFDEIRSVYVRSHPFFKSLIIELKEKNQRFSLCNVAFTGGLVEQVSIYIKDECNSV